MIRVFDERILMNMFFDEQFSMNSMFINEQFLMNMFINEQFSMNMFNDERFSMNMVFDERFLCKCSLMNAFPLSAGQPKFLVRAPAKQHCTLASKTCFHS